MIRMKMYPRNPVTDPYEADTTLGRAVQELLEQYARYDQPLLQVSWEDVTLLAQEDWGGFGYKQYYAYLVLKKSEDDPLGELTYLLTMGRAIQLITNWGDGEATRIPTMPAAVNGYLVVVPQDRTVVTRVMAACLGAQWLLGRDIDWGDLGNPELPTAIGMAVREELENGVKVEETLRALLGD